MFPCRDPAQFPTRDASECQGKPILREMRLYVMQADCHSSKSWSYLNALRVSFDPTSWFQNGMLGGSLHGTCYLSSFVSRLLQVCNGTCSFECRVNTLNVLLHRCLSFFLFASHTQYIRQNLVADLSVHDFHPPKIHNPLDH